MKTVAILALGLGLTASSAQAVTIVDFAGSDNPALATGSAIVLLVPGNAIVGALTNTSPFDASITGFGFDVGPGNIDGFTGVPDPITFPADVNFAFGDGPLGTVPGFSSVDLDFGYLTGASFADGFPDNGLAPGQTLGFIISGAFAGLTETQIASGLYVRFENVGLAGALSEVATTADVVPALVPEPAAMLMLGSGLLLLARRFKSPTV